MKRKAIRKRRQRRYPRNQFGQTNRLLMDGTKAMIGLTVFGATANMASEVLKK
jgi:hypothetical protein